MNNYDPWSTHLPALASAVHTYGDRVLEIGAGWYSTPLLRAMSKNVITLENDAAWAERFQCLCNGSLYVVKNLILAVENLSAQPWDVVFVDCEGNDMRRRFVELFLNEPICIVAHDTQEDHYKPLLSTIKYQKHFAFIMPRTSHLSNVLDVTQ